MSPLLSGSLVALCALILLESLLRISGFSYLPPDFGSDGVEAPVLDPLKVAAQGKNDWRVVIVGESTVGMFGIMAPLAEKLQPRTKRDVKLINFGISSYGSTRLLRHMPEILSLKPDLLVIYIGHNEFEEALRPSDGVVKALNGFLLVHLRMFQAVSRLIHGLGAEVLAANLEALKAGHRLLPNEVTFRYDQLQNKEHVYSRFRKNIRSMIQIAKSRGVKVLLSTVAYNRRSTPFMLERPEQWKEAEAMIFTGNFTEARRLLEKAQDDDLAPHHANETVNRILRELAVEQGVPLFDADAWIVDEADHGIPGFKQFIDHCHLELRQWIMALQRQLAEKILAEGLLTGS